MIALLWMLNPLWEGFIAPAILISIGYWMRPRLERWYADLDRRYPPGFFDEEPPSHVRPLRHPYDQDAD